MRNFAYRGNCMVRVQLTNVPRFVVSWLHVALDGQSHQTTYESRTSNIARMLSTVRHTGINPDDPTNYNPVPGGR